MSKEVRIAQCSHVVQAVVGDSMAIGYNRIVFKLGQDVAMRALQMQTKRRWNGERIPRHSARGPSASNGVAEKAIQEIEAHARTLIMALEVCVGIRSGMDIASLFWLIEYAAELPNRLKVQKRDGRTSYERTLGNGDAQGLVDLGEAVC